ncbi:MAG: protein kinase [Gemmataceae bacterium]
MADPNEPTRTITEASASVPPSTASRSDTLGVAAHAASPAALYLIGDYTILGELGRGGMGVVYRAEDSKLKREVALKVMLPQFAANPQAKARFVREARAQAKVEHDHVAAIYRVDEHDGLPYLVMPLLKGMTLHAALRANPRPPLMEVIRIGREMAEGLAAAHEKGLVHRDIKPANVWLEGKKLRVKVLDFGLARVSDNDAADATDGPVTREGAVLGTPAYMSPEQGRGLPVDGRTDLWSLGVVMYQMTTGELPFRGPNTLAILTSLAIDHPPPPMTRNPSVPQLLSDFIMQLLAKDPAYRPPTAEFVAEQLRAIEHALVNAVRMIPFTPTQQFEIQPEGPDPFADLDATEANSVPDAESLDEPAARATPQSKARGGFPIWAMVGGVLLAVVAIVGIVISQMGKKPEPDVAKNEPPPVTPKPIPPKPKDNTDPVKKAVAWVLNSGGKVEGGVPGGFVPITNPDEIAGPIQAIRFAEGLTDEAGLENLRGLPSLHTLDLSITPLTDAGFKNLAGMPFAKILSSLNVRGAKLTDAALDQLGFPDLVGLNLGGRFTPDRIGKLRQLTKLRTLSMGSCDLTDDHLLRLKDLPLTELYLGENRRLTDVGLANLGRMPQLTTMTIDGTGITDQGLKGVPSAMPALSILGLSGKTAVTKEGIQVFRDSRLRLLDLGNAELTAENCPPLPRCEIRAGGNVIAEPSDVHWREAARLVRLPNRKVTVKLADGKRLEATKPDELPNDSFTLVGVELSGGTPEEVKRLEAIPTLETFTEAGGAITPDSIRALLASKASLMQFYSASELTNAEIRVIGEFSKLKTVHATGPKVTDAGIAHLVPLKELVNVALPGTAITGDGVKQLAGLPALRSLVVFETALGDADIEALFPLKGLHHLHIARTRITEAGMKQLQKALPKCKIEWEEPNQWVSKALLGEGLTVSVRTAAEKEILAKQLDELPAEPFTLIRVSRGTARLTDAHLKWMEATPTIISIDAPGVSITAAGLRSLQASRNTLTDLYLNGALVTDEMCAELAKLTALSGLNFEREGQLVTDVGLKHLADLPKLQALFVGGSQITDAGLKPLATMPWLRGLSLAQTAITDTGLATLKEIPKLSEVILDQTHVTEAGFKQLQQALPKCKISWEDPKVWVPKWLQHRNIAGTVRLTDGSKVPLKGLDPIPAGAVVTQLMVLEPRGTFTDSDLLRLELLPNLEIVELAAHFRVTATGLNALLSSKDTLTNLAIVGGEFPEESAKVLAQLPKLELLKLQGTSLTDTGLAHLAGLSHLGMLFLDRTKITDAGLKHLSGLKLVNTLGLANTAITDAGVETLAGMAHFGEGNGATIDLTGTRVSEAGAKRLQTALPKARVKWNKDESGSLFPSDGWVSLTPILDAKKDQPTPVGTWVRTERGLEGSHDQPNNMVRLKLPLIIHEDYELEVELTRPKFGLSGAAIEIPVGADTGVAVVLDYNGKAGLVAVDGRDLNINGTAKELALDATKPSRVLIRVTRARDQENTPQATVKVAVNEKPLLDWTGNPQRLAITSGGFVPGTIDLGFGPPGKLVIHSVRFRVLAGVAKLTRSADLQKLLEAKKP